MQELLQQLIASLERDETIAIATIIKRKGSVPREVGAKMLVARDGTISGTVGGGCGEAEVWRSALTAIELQRPCIVQVDLTEEIAMDSQGVCGGIFDVFVEPWYKRSSSPHHRPIGQPDMRDIATTIHATLAGEHAIVLLTIVTAAAVWRPSVGQHMLIAEDGSVTGSFELPGASPTWQEELVQASLQAIAAGKPQIINMRGLASTWAEVFVEPFTPPPVLLIAGAGHIAAPLAAIANIMGYSVSVTDDRASFANRERFPTAQHILVGDIETTLRRYPITPRTHIVLVTRAHAHDVQGLRAIIESPAAYIGMIGSQRRVWAVFKLLHDEGVSPEKLLRVRAPIGLDLGGATPSEIALCILAEITSMRYHGTGQALSDSLRARYLERLQRLDSQAT